MEVTAALGLTTEPGRDFHQPVGAGFDLPNGGRLADQLVWGDVIEFHRLLIWPTSWSASKRGIGFLLTGQSVRVTEEY